MKTQTESIAALRTAMDKAESDQQFDIAADLRALQQQYGALNKREYQQLLARLVEKYTTDVQAVVYTALVAKCKAGDAAAIKVFYEQQAATTGGTEECVKIVDNL